MSSAPRRSLHSLLSGEDVEPVASNGVSASTDWGAIAPSTPDNTFPTGVFSPGLPSERTLSFGSMITNDLPPPPSSHFDPTSSINNLSTAANNSSSQTMPSRKRSRQIESNEDLNVGQDTVVVQRRVQHARQSLLQYEGLTQEQQEDILKFAVLPPADMLIELRINQCRDFNLLSTHVMELELKDPKAEKAIRSRMLATLCNQDAPAYLEGVSSSVFAHIQKQPTVYGLSAKMVQNPILFDAIKDIAKRGLIHHRSEIKRKISEYTPVESVPKKTNKKKTSDVAKPTDIYSLSVAILNNDIQPQPRWWARLAFLRNTYCDWVAAEGNKDGQPSDKYWKYVDEALQNVRAEVGKKPEGERAECVKILFQNLLKQDLKRHPPPESFKIPTTASTLTWQTEIVSGLGDNQLVYREK